MGQKFSKKWVNFQSKNSPLIIDTQVLDYINSNYKYTELIKVNGDSMYPFIHEDSLIFVDTSNKGINNKDVFVVNVNDELFIKQIIYQGNSFTLKSFNSEYKDINVKADELVVIGKVKGVLNKI